MPRSALTPRQRLLRGCQQHQDTTFAIIGITMIVAAVAAASALTGIVPIPSDNDLSAKVKHAEIGDVPCLRVGARPVTPSQVTITVINTTRHQGPTSKTMDISSTVGFRTEEPVNSDVEYADKVRVTARADSVDTTYSMARFSPGSHVCLNDAEDAAVTVEPGTFYGDTVSAEDVQHVPKSNDSIGQSAKCQPMSGMKQD